MRVRGSQFGPGGLICHLRSCPLSSWRVPGCWGFRTRKCQIHGIAPLYLHHADWSDYTDIALLLSGNYRLYSCSGTDSDTAAADGNRYVTCHYSRGRIDFHAVIGPFG